MELTGKTVVVCGIGPGLGRSIALRCAHAGADVVLAARTGSRLTELAKEVTALGRTALAVPTDITDDAAAANLRDSTLREFGRVDTLVLNAFRMPPLSDLIGLDLAEVRAAFETNVFAALRLATVFAPALADAGGSVVVINSSVLRHSRRTFGAYKMTKASLLALAQSLATELGPRGIRVNSVAPGYIWADSLKWYFGYLAEQRGVSAEEVYREVADTIDLRRLPEPDEIADAVVLLASDLARAITGQCLDVNCGEFHH